MPARKNTPGCTTCCGGTGLCPGCSAVSASYPATLLIDIPGLGLTNVLLTRPGGVGPAWIGCATASVLGFALCTSPGASCSTPTTITSAFQINFQCTTVSGSHVWYLVLRYAIALGYTCSIGTLSPTDQWRAVDTTCPNLFCANVGLGSLSFPFWTTPQTCAIPGTVTFTGAPSFAPTSAPNLYFGTGGATVHP